MIAVNMLKGRLDTELNFRGVDYTFREIRLNEFNEPREIVDVVTIRGIYHENKSNTFMDSHTSEAGEVWQTFMPQILCRYEDSKKVKIGYLLCHGSKNYKVIAKDNVQNYGILCEISLEQVGEAHAVVC